MSQFSLSSWTGIEGICPALSVLCAPKSGREQERKSLLTLAQNCPDPSSSLFTLVGIFFFFWRGKLPLESTFSIGIFKRGAEFYTGILLFTHCFKKGINPTSPRGSQGRISPFLINSWFVNPAPISEFVFLLSYLQFLPRCWWNKILGVTQVDGESQVGF